MIWEKVANILKENFKLHGVFIETEKRKINNGKRKGKKTKIKLPMNVKVELYGDIRKEEVERITPLLTELAKLEVLDLAIELGGITDVERLLPEILDACRRVTEASLSSILLKETEGEGLIIYMSRGKGAVRGIKVPPGKGVAGWVVNHGKPAIVNNPSEDPRFFPEVDKLTGFHTKNLMAVPLIFRGRILGALEVINKNEPFNEYDLEILTLLAYYAASTLYLARLFHNLQKRSRELIITLVNVLEAKDPYTKGHSVRVAKYSWAIGKHMGLNTAQLKELELAALLHDIGKVGIHESILLKPEPLSPAEKMEINRHPEIGARILSQVEAFKHIVPAVLHHHERWDGKGYPEGKKGEEIPLLARIISVADVFDALTSCRPYRSALSPQEALIEIKKSSGTQFDPKCVEAFEKAFNQKEIP